jgi:hypothetical protein
MFTYYFIFFFAIASILLYRSAKSKVLKFINENYKSINFRIVNVTIHYGIFNILLGFAHRLLLHAPLHQLFVLLAIESCYLVYLLCNLISSHFIIKALAIMFCSMNCSRLLFILSLLVYQLFPNLEGIIGRIQESLFYSFIAIWCLSAIISIIYKFKIIWKSAKKSAKVAPLQLISHNQDIIFIQ